MELFVAKLERRNVYFRYLNKTQHDKYCVYTALHVVTARLLGSFNLYHIVTNLH